VVSLAAPAVALPVETLGRCFIALARPDPSHPLPFID
jgi:hypothetical protein